MSVSLLKNIMLNSATGYLEELTAEFEQLKVRLK